MKALINRLKRQGKQISCAESCTGGLVAKGITDVSGASSVFQCGIVTYSNQMKQELLSVSKETLDKFGAVSEEVAREMALGVMNKSGSDIAVSVTGLAGPEGDSSGKPVGTVCIGVATSEKCYATTFVFAGKRNEIRRRAAKMALNMAYDELGGQKPEKQKRTRKKKESKKKESKKKEI